MRQEICGEKKRCRTIEKTGPQDYFRSSFRESYVIFFLRWIFPQIRDPHTSLVSKVSNRIKFQSQVTPFRPRIKSKQKHWTYTNSQLHKILEPVFVGFKSNEESEREKTDLSDFCTGYPSDDHSEYEKQPCLVSPTHLQILDSNLKTTEKSVDFRHLSS